MTKSLVLEVSYIAEYGSDIDSHMVLPIEVNGVMLPKFELPMEIPGGVFLGEIEGKHSECYGDLILREVDFESGELTQEEANHLIGSSDPGYFEGFFEREGMKLFDNGEYSEEKEDELLDKHNANSDGFAPNELSFAFVSHLMDNYYVKMKSLKVDESDYEMALKVLKSLGIKVS